VENRKFDNQLHESHVMTARPHLTHVALFVKDPARTVDFYQRFAGLHLVHDRTDNGTRVVWLSETEHDPEFVIVAIAAPPGQAEVPPHMAHFGYDVPSRAAVEEIATRAEQEAILELAPTDAGAIVGYICIVRDPDGNLVEFSHGQPINPKRLK
jgi:catechol 2,3-dioxygenase-like lactoylglutathione lyase family enzyme